MDRWRERAVVLAMAVALPLGRIGAALRQEGSLPMLQMQTPLPQQIGEHRIVEQPQFGRCHLQCDMAIAEVICRPQQLQGFGSPNQQQGFRGGFDLHQRRAVVAAQPFPRLKRLTARQLEQQGLTAEAVAQAPQARAFVGAEGKSPARLATCGRGWQTPAGEAEGRSGSPVETCGTASRFTASRFTESRDGFRRGLGTDGVVVHCSHPGEPAPIQCALSKPPHHVQKAGHRPP